MTNKQPPRGVKVLRKEIEKDGRLALARRLGLSPPSIYNWAQGFNRPNMAARQRLREVLGIPVDAWGDR